MTELFRIFSTSWPLAFMVVGICLILLLRRVVKWREREDREERVFKSDSARAVVPRREREAGTH